MDRTRTIEGRWCIQGADGPAHPGMLSYDPEKGLSLTVEVPRSSNCGKDCIPEQRGVSNPAEVPVVVHGTTDELNKPVTLFGCRWSGSKLTSSLCTYHIKSLGGIINFRAASANDAKFSVACVRYTLLSQWTDRHPVPEDQPQHHLVCLKVGAHNLVEAELSTGARLKIEETVRPWSSAREFRIEMRHCAWFLFSKPTPVLTIFTNYARVLCRLLCLLSGERAFIEGIYLYDHDPSGPLTWAELIRGASEFLMANDGVTGAERDVYASRMVAPFTEIESAARSIFERWFECHEQLGPVVDLYFEIVSNPALIIENRFLFLAQALEVYHACSGKFSRTDPPAAVDEDRVKAVLQSAPSEHLPWLRKQLSRSTPITLDARIDQVLSLHRSEADSLTAGIADFAKKVLDGRNYYTHYPRKLRQSGKFPKGRELNRITFALEALLKVCLLKELGLQGKPIERFVECARDSSWRYYDIEDTSNQPGQC